MVAAAMERGGVVVPMAAVAVIAVIVSLSSASPSVAFPLDLDSTVQRVDRLPMEEEREAGQHDVTNIEGAVHRTDPETRGLLVVLEFADDARFSRHITATAATPSAPAPSATAHVVDRDRGGRGAGAAVPVAAFEGHVIDPRLRRARSPREGSGVVSLIGEQSSRRHRGRRKGDVIAVHIGGHHRE